ncbi:MAG: response regulator [Candidatus Omnitrophota bacterium]
MSKEIIKVLIIEDNPDDVNLLREMLRKSGRVQFIIENAEDLSKGIEYLKGGRYDALILDLGLPDSDYLETLRRIKEQTQEMPVLVLTGLSDEDISRQALREGAQDYLIKGEFNSELLKRAIYYAIERMKTEKVLKETKRQMEFIFAATKTNMDIIDAEFNLVYVDSHWREIYGDPKGRKCYEYFADRKTMCPTCGIPKALESKTTVVTEKVLPKEGNRPIQVTTTPFKNEKGEWLVAEVNVDIAERKTMEEALRRSETLFRTAVTSLPIGVFLLNEQGVFILSEGQGLEIMGIFPEKVLGKSAFEIFADNRNIIECIRSAYKKEKQKLMIDVDVYSVQVECSPIVDQAGQVENVIGVMIDLTDRIKIENELKENLTELRQFQQVTIDRENKMIELKKEINALSQKLGKPVPYDLSSIE